MNRFKKFIKDNPQYDNNKPLDEDDWKTQTRKSLNAFEKYVLKKELEEKEPQIEKE